jgi:hypothetical protein
LSCGSQPECPQTTNLQDNNSWATEVYKRSAKRAHICWWREEGFYNTLSLVGIIECNYWYFTVSRLQDFNTYFRPMELLVWTSVYWGMQQIIALTFTEQKYIFLRLRFDSIQKSVTLLYILMISDTFILSLQKKETYVFGKGVWLHSCDAFSYSPIFR